MSRLRDESELRSNSDEHEAIGEGRVNSSKSGEKEIATKGATAHKHWPCPEKEQPEGEGGGCGLEGRPSHCPPSNIVVTHNTYDCINNVCLQVNSQKSEEVGT